ncbi:hypothetical protein CSV69_16100 [Sporosarcina sp. P26b]|uniref:hypothetical protein n=1 Tax=Sporosarcina sp. P26b TaxID=2048253 RepID=UPI000C172B22|nr:hypothetical protein [Sporosarcina sp. P26b]PIC94561.1 hypothetical protein CSV69_16100 [Sporosarcina sp. P26b]
MDEILNISVTDIVQVLITLVNVAVVYLVYKLTRKEVNPKIHLVPVKRKPIEVTEDDEYSIFEVYDDYLNIVNNEILTIDFDQRGFPDSSQYHAPLVWEIEVHNKSDYIATFIELEYEITIYKVEMQFGIDELDITSEEYVPYNIFKRSINFDYLASDDKKVFKVLYLHGEFIKADIIITKLKSKELEFISTPIRLDEYKQPMLDWLSDSHHHRQVIGSYKPIK